MVSRVKYTLIASETAPRNCCLALVQEKMRGIIYLFLIVYTYSCQTVVHLVDKLSGELVSAHFERLECVCFERGHCHQFEAYVCSSLCRHRRCERRYYCDNISYDSGRSHLYSAEGRRNCDILVDIVKKTWCPKGLFQLGNQNIT